MKFRLALFPAAICGLVFLLAACTGRPYLIVDYNLPSIGSQLKGQTVRLNIKDLREDVYILSPAAAVEFREFQNRYSLSWKMDDGSRQIVGQYDLRDLFYQTFKKRLERLGVEVATDVRSQDPVFEVVIEKLKVDLQGRKWLADMSYEVNLSRDSHLIARERISGKAERAKLIGRKGADTVLSEIFSEIINRADIVKLFQQAKLI